MGSRNRNKKKSAEPNSHHLITYKDSFLYPITRNGSTQKIRISLQGLFFLVPTPTPPTSSQEDLSIKMVKLSGKNL
jgi:hypothetical protein